MSKPNLPTLVGLGLKQSTFDKLRKHKIFTRILLCQQDEGGLVYRGFSAEEIQEIKTALARHDLKLMPGGS